MKDNVNDIITRLQDLVEDKATLRLIVKEGTRLKIVNRRLQTSKTVDVSRIVGREGEKEVLVCRLLGDEPCDRNFSVVPIVGMGGVGKKNSS
ncbi:putative P-loop containing nucleoside triphosphate hydrolase [Helianthus annuus]|uniref:P-loop containing nucleoside triphosphate hydrolase n=1 Tax=Helianthus annuus TaxID=4232 RepID=A0A9K3IUF3_HELAN|nr:putative P-loop containing nucleoside triphosphate hydrolase [Helianthus annuus]KAJ0915296.1 putative P-loop containing nucleoside triphosphate hydrolase [Helianthus annuus]